VLPCPRLASSALRTAARYNANQVATQLAGKECLVKLLIYSHAFAPQVGGIETFATHLARGLTKADPAEDTNNFSVTVVTQVPGTEQDKCGLPPFRIVRRPSSLELWRLVSDADRILLAGPAILPLAFALIRRKVLIVSHHGYQSICPNGMLFQFPTQTCCPGHFAAGRYRECVKCNAPKEKMAGSIRLLLLTFVRRALSRLASSNVAVSEHVAMRIALPRLRVIRNGVPDMPSSRLFFASADPRDAPIGFAYVGRLVTEKGVSVLVKAARVLKSWGCHFQVLVIGDGPEREVLQALASSLNLDKKVCFLGFQKGLKLEESMSKVSALVMPSICEDVAPFSVLEQMMQERLIIGSKIGGLAEEVGDTGLTFEPGNANALAERMRQVIQQPQWIETLGKRARERALALYSLQHQLNEYRELLRAG
jgi:glycogen(starch) synthase